MTENPDNQPAADDGQISRPPSVDRAIYALIARCVLAIAAAFALYGARSEVRDSLAKTDAAKNWSAAVLDQHVSTNLRSNVIAMIVYSLMVLVIAKYIRDGKGWARWLYLVFAFLIPGDVLQVLGFVAGKDALLRVVSGLYGLSAIAAVILLFLPSSSAYFRKPGSAPLLAGMFGSRGRQASAAARSNVTVGRPPAEPAGPDGTVESGAIMTDATEADRTESAAIEPGSEATSTPAARRQPPRAKSRKRAEQ